MQKLARERVSVIIVLQTSLLLTSSKQIAASALASRLPTVYGYREHVLAGGLVSYGVDLRWCYYRGAYFVDNGVAADGTRATAEGAGGRIR
jgi:putative ABC transport system substrate-binding protein